MKPEPLEKVAEYVGVFAEGDLLETFYGFQCPSCEAVFQLHYDARGTDVQCEHCPWKGKAGQ
jgi:hypothetical protein